MFKIFFAVLINIIVIVEYLSPVAPKVISKHVVSTTEDPASRMQQLCTNLRTSLTSHSVGHIINNLNDQWKFLHPQMESKDVKAEVKKGMLNEIFRNCGIRTEMSTMITSNLTVYHNITKENVSRRTEQGRIDIRTLDQTDANFVMKVKFHKPVCAAFGQLLKYIETESFQKLYPNETVVLLVVSFRENEPGPGVIEQWIAMRCKNGDVIDGLRSRHVKCLKAKEYSWLQHKASSEPSEEYDSSDESEELSSAERVERVAQLCSDLKTYLRNNSISDIVKNLNAQWKVLYPDEMGTKSRNRSRAKSEDKLNKMIQDCGIPTVIQTPVTRFTDSYRNKTEKAGIIDIRTLHESNANLIIKHRYKKPSCGALRQLLLCLEADNFEQLYPNEKVTLLALNFKVMFGQIIYEWVGLVHQKGEIVSAEHATKCLHSKEFSDLKYKGKPVVEYFDKAN